MNKKQKKLAIIKRDIEETEFRINKDREHRLNLIHSYLKLKGWSIKRVIYHGENTSDFDYEKGCYSTACPDSAMSHEKAECPE